MNYLAHLYLAEDDDAALVGNLLGDFVKGRIDAKLDSPIYRGVKLHRAIDRFTDAHPIHRLSRRRISTKRRRCAGIIVDMAYDHFLARHWPRLRKRPLDEFAQRVYEALYRRQAVLPPSLRRVLPRMVREDWLTGYRELDNVAVAIARLAFRLSRPTALLGGISEIRGAYRELESDFTHLLPALKRFVELRHAREMALQCSPCEAYPRMRISRGAGKSA